MFSIRRIHDDVLPVNRAAILEVKQIFADQFSGAPKEELDYIGDKMHNPFKLKFRTILYVAENARRRVSGFALVLHEPVLNFCYLDFIATAKNIKGRGIGAALYERVRDEAFGLGVKGIFFECLPDEPEHCLDPQIRKQNAARMKFYEHYGAFPIMGTAYETPVPDGDPDNLPHMMFDGLDRKTPLAADFLRKVIPCVLVAKYSELCPPSYVKAVVKSIKDDPVRLRPFQYLKPTTERKPPKLPALETLLVTINDKHDIHHMRDRGYVESPVRITVIQKELERSGLIQIVPIKHYPDKHILDVHKKDYFDYIKRACESTPENKSVYPYVFPIRNATRPPKELSIRAGYYCIDTFTPINRNAFLAARRAVDCTLTAASEILEGRRCAYALVRPPGHHAESRVFGGFCYFNNSAIAANYLMSSRKSRDPRRRLSSREWSTRDLL